MRSVGAPYYQFCPVAKAMELLDERWTMLLLRELLLGTEHFNELRRGLPECLRHCCRIASISCSAPDSRAAG